MPSDITGINFYNQKAGEFEFRPGPIQANIVLADEINRATPRTQSSLLEAMEERQVTVEGVTAMLPAPFLVIATQNPIELEGTFPLPEAQLDRFFMRVKLGYPTEEEEEEILLRFEEGSPLTELEPVTTDEELVRLSRLVAHIYCEPSVRRYVVSLVQATRHHAAYELGASPRGSMGLFKGARALAAIRGRDYVLPDDVKFLAPYILTHRAILNSQSRLRGRDAAGVLEGDHRERRGARGGVGALMPSRALLRALRGADRCASFSGCSALVSEGGTWEDTPQCPRHMGFVPATPVSKPWACWPKIDASLGAQSSRLEAQSLQLVAFSLQPGRRRRRRGSRVV